MEARGGTRSPGGTPATRFWKMSGSGNDFIVVEEGVASGIADLAEWVRRVCRRALSVGADGVLVVGPGVGGEVRLAHFNADGGRASLCGNGTRCAARWARLRGLGGDPLRLRTDAGIVEASFPDEGQVRIRLGARCGHPDRRRLDLPGGTSIAGSFLTVGIPHFISRVERIAAAPVETVGREVRLHAAFGAAGTNVSFVEVRRNGSLDVRTFERGVEAETLACGTGCMAAAAVAADEGWASSPVTCHPRSGLPVTVEFRRTADGFEEMSLTGDARFIYEGRLHPEGLAWARPGAVG